MVQKTEISQKETGQGFQDKKDLSLLNNMMQTLMTAQSLKEGLNEVIAQLCAYGDFQYGECWMPLYGQPLVKIKSSWGMNDRFKSMETASEECCYDILTDRPEIFDNTQCFFSGDLSRYQNFSRIAEAAALDLNSLLSVPIVYREKLQAVILLFSTKRLHQPSVDTDKLQKLLSILGGELARSESKDELERFINLSPELMSIIGFDGYTKKTNQAFQDLHGYSNEETASMMVLSFVHPDDLTIASDAWEKIIHGHPLKNLELRYRCKDGNYRWLSCSTQSFPEDKLLYLIARDITAQKKQLDELELIKLAIENTSDAIGVASDLTHAFYLNKSFGKQLGWTLEELNHIGWKKMFVDPQLPYTIVDTILLKGSWEGDVEMYHRNGHILDINMSANAQLNTDGSPKYLIGVCRNITEQKKAQLELKKLSTAIEHSLNEVYIITPENGQFSYVNARALHNLGYSPEEMEYLKPREINPDYTRFPYRKMFAHLIRGRKKHLQYQTYHIRKDGSRYPVAIQLSAFHYKHHYSILANVVDISERQKAEEALRISNERYQLVSRATNEAIWDFVIDKNIFYYGEGYRTLFGHDFGNTFSGMEQWAENIHPEDAERVVGNIYDILITNLKEWSIEYRFRCVDGSYKFVKDRGYVIYNNKGEATRMIGAMADFTDQKNNELLLREFNAELERKVEEKTASLAQALQVLHQGEQARIKTEKSLQQSLKEKEVLIMEIHHRVKNNMAIISGLLSLQARQVKSDELKTILKDSQARIRSMALIHELLYQHKNLARINFKKYIHQLIEGIGDSYPLTDKRIHLSIQAAAAELDIVQAVPCGLILNELITNSYKYAFSHQQEGEILIVFDKLEDSFRLRIADNGIGLPEDFDLRKARSLGMQLIASLVRQIGGALEIVHQPGASFTLTWQQLPHET